MYFKGYMGSFCDVKRKDWNKLRCVRKFKISEVEKNAIEKYRDVKEDEEGI